VRDLTDIAGCVQSKWGDSGRVHFVLDMRDNTTAPHATAQARAMPSYVVMRRGGKRNGLVDTWYDALDALEVVAS
jgi:hypothetical protein